MKSRSHNFFVFIRWQSVYRDYYRALIKILKNIQSTNNPLFRYLLGSECLLNLGTIE